ncbi:MAG: transposase [Kiritimatiellae bacterium]|nr:transposase [Kiritimatiellia bacterium]
MISSIRLDGSTACMTINAAADAEGFRVFVNHVLCPSLREGDIVIMDNLSSHKSGPTIELIETMGAQVLFLPAYSPDLNPIEKMWSKVKESLRAAEARTQEELIEAISHALECVIAQDAMNWFASCGYSFIKSALERYLELMRGNLPDKHLLAKKNNQPSRNPVCGIFFSFLLNQDIYMNNLYVLNQLIGAFQAKMWFVYSIWRCRL